MTKEQVIAESLKVLDNLESAKSTAEAFGDFDDLANIEDTCKNLLKRLKAYSKAKPSKYPQPDDNEDTPYVPTRDELDTLNVKLSEITSILQEKLERQQDETEEEEEEIEDEEEEENLKIVRDTVTNDLSTHPDAW